MCDIQINYLFQTTLHAFLNCRQIKSFFRYIKWRKYTDYIAQVAISYGLFVRRLFACEFHP